MAVGKNVVQFKPGDTVFGGGEGTFAEHACARESKLATKPEAVSFEQAASVPIAGLTALQALRDKGHVRPGQKVLINGASGGVGTFAVQIAKSFGANVTGVCSTKNHNGFLCAETRPLVSLLRIICAGQLCAADSRKPT